MTPRPRLLLLLCGLIPTVAIALLSLWRPVFMTPLENRAYDSVIRMADRPSQSGRVVIVDIDERSLATIGQWPWRRDVIATLVTRLRSLDAAAIALDMIFAEPDRDGDASADSAFAEALRGGRVVIGYAFTFDDGQIRADRCGDRPLPLAIIRPDDESDDPFFRATGSVCSLAMLARSAEASGFLNAAPDSDGLLRRAPLLIEHGGRVYPGLAVTAVAEATRTRSVVLHVLDVNSSSLTLGDRHIALDGKSNALLHYRGRKRTFQYVSAADVLNGTVPSDMFAGRIAFVGTTALGTREVVSTPLDTLFTGVEVQATLADNLLQQDSVERPTYAVALETELVIAVGLVVALLVRRRGLAWSALAAAFMLAGLWGGAVFTLARESVYVSPFYPTLSLAASLGAVFVAVLVTEQHRAERADLRTDGTRRLMVETLLSLTETRDPETGGHSRRTERYTRVLARELATHPRFSEYLTPERVDLLARLAPLHDIGKVGVPDHLLRKMGALTSAELMEMRKHPTYGRDVIAKAEELAGVRDDEALAMAKDIVYTHHEWWDGAGYPQGLSGTDIPIAGRIVAIIDVYDAVLTRRLYSSPMSHDETVAFIVGARGTHFDPAVVDAFVRIAPVLRDLVTDPTR
jgi:adenylate cyclase